MASHVETIVRAADLLNIQFEFVNLRLDETSAGDPRLRRIDNRPAHIVVRFPPQHVAEYVHNGSETRTLPYKSVVAGASRLAFELPQSTSSIPFKLVDLLDLIGKLPPVEFGGGGPATVLEVPFRLLLTPRNDVSFVHRRAPKVSPSAVTGLNWTELWHTRMKPTDAAAQAMRLRAIDNPADVDDPVIPALNMTLDRARRKEIVRLSQLPQKYVVESPSLLLTSLGATAKFRSAWREQDSSALSAWEHQVVSGRDSFVRVVDQGYLYPFRHRASREIITRRDFVSLNATTRVAELQRQVFIRVRDSEVNYEQFTGIYKSLGREMPLKQIRITSQPSVSSDPQAPVRVSAVGIDCCGQSVDFQLTAYFVPKADAGNPAALAAVKQKFLRDNKVTIAAQRMALADDPRKEGGTSLSVSSLDVTVQDLSPAETVPPLFLPRIVTASVGLPAVEQLFGSVADTTLARAASARTMVLHEKYLSEGIQAGDRKQVFAKLYPPLPSLSVPAERAGGLAAPTFQPMDGLSRLRGIVSDVDGLMENRPINVDQLIADAKLLGMIQLKALIDTALDNVPIDNPEQLFQVVDDDGVFITRPVVATVRNPQSGEMEARFLWKPRMKSGVLPPPIVSANGRTLGLTVKGRIRKDRSGGPTFEIEGRLSDFGLNFQGLLTVDFNKVGFKSGASRKLSFETDIAAVRFGEKLAFIEKLARLIPTGGLGDKPPILPTPEGVVVRFAIAIPSFAIGAMSIQNIAVVSSVSLPFVPGKPAAVRVSLSERSAPFLVSVSIFGGTGFFAVEARSDGTILVEAAIEFGGIVSINLLGIVKGGVYVFVGIHVAAETGREPNITGYLRMGGYVDVLGLVSVSIEVYVGLTYRISENALIGEGRLTVSVKILFFSLSKSFVITRKIEGFGGAPTDEPTHPMEHSDQRALLPDFTSTMSRVQWGQYCEAFA